jgi:uncharacterized protein
VGCGIVMPHLPPTVFVHAVHRHAVSIQRLSDGALGDQNRCGVVQRADPSLGGASPVDAERSGRVAYRAMEFADRYGPWALVAGASEGVGASLARLLGQRGVNVVLVSRRQTALDEVAETVVSSTRAVAMDLSEPDAGEQLANVTADLEIGLLIYNAGADPHMSRFLERPVDSWQAMLTRNCATVLDSSHHFGGLMAERGHGGIALVTSGAAWAGGSRLAVYGATKAFDLILAESLWSELAPLGVDVLAAVLGQTDTPALRKLLGDREIAGLADPNDVARDVLDHLANGPTWPPDASPLGSIPRRQAVELMSQGSATIFGSAP